MIRSMFALLMSEILAIRTCGCGPPRMTWLIAVTTAYMALTGVTLTD